MASAHRKYIPVYLLSIERYHRTMLKKGLILFFPSLTLVASLLIIIANMTNIPSKRLQVAINVAGEPLNDSLTDPSYKSQDVILWAEKATTRLFDFSKPELQKHLAELKLDYFTPRGYQSFYRALDSIQLLDWLKISNHASIFSPKEINLIREGISSNSHRYKWRFEIKGLLITLNNGKDNSAPYILTVDIERVSKLGHEFAIRISRVFAKKVKSNADKK